MQTSSASKHRKPVRTTLRSSGSLLIGTIELQEAQGSMREELAKAEGKDVRIQELEASLQELSTRAEQQQQTISLLVSEKTQLTASVERLQDAESSMVVSLYVAVRTDLLPGLQEMTSLFEAERDRAVRLQSTVQDLTVQSRDATERIAQLTISEKALTDKTRDLVRASIDVYRQPNTHSV